MKCKYCEKTLKPYDLHYCQEKDYWKNTNEMEGDGFIYYCPFCDWRVIPDEVDDHCPNCKAELKFK